MNIVKTINKLFINTLAWIGLFSGLGSIGFYVYDCCIGGCNIFKALMLIILYIFVTLICIWIIVLMSREKQ